MPVVKGEQGGLAADRHGVGDEPAAGLRGGPAGSSSPGSPTPPPTKMASGWGRPARQSGALPSTRTSSGVPSAAALVRMRAARVGSRSMAKALPAVVAAQPLDGDAAAAGTDVPERLAGQGHEAGHGDGADLGLGQLAVMLKGVVGQARHRRQEWRVGVGPGLDGDQVEVADPIRGQIGGSGSGHQLVGPAEILEHGRRSSGRSRSAAAWRRWRRVRCRRR